MRLIIAEKPSMGRSIAGAVGAKKTSEDYFEGNGYIVSWCFGHLYELADLEHYWNPDYVHGQKVSWEDSLKHLPFFPDRWKFDYRPKEDCEQQIVLLKRLINRKDVDTIYAAGDADREGEVIVRLVLDNNLSGKKRLLRLWLHNTEDSAVRSAIHEAKPIEQYEKLYLAGKARAAEDWLIGIELTRFASVKAGEFIRMGRCVCPIVAKIVERDLEIENFVPEQYYVVAGEFEKDGLGFPLQFKQQYKTKDEADAFARIANSLHTVVEDVDRRNVKLGSYRLFSMSDLQSYICKNDKSFKPKDVLEATQALYEKGYVTYPRTPSNYLCHDEALRIDGVISAMISVGFRNLINKKTSRKIYDDTKVESHSALTPTEKIPTSFSSNKEKTVYETIRNRFLAVFCSVPCVVERTTYRISCGEEKFTVNGDVLKDKGWLQYEQITKDDRDLPKLEKGDILDVRYETKERTTVPPRRFTVSTLNDWMITPMKKDSGLVDHREYTDEEWKDILDEATICTEATRADTIERCIESKYIVLNRGIYKSTEFGRYMVDVMNELGIDLNVAKTVQLSRDLHGIAVGKVSPEHILEDVRKMLSAVIRDDVVIKSTYKGQKKRTVIGTCPFCGNSLMDSEKGYYCRGYKKDGTGCNIKLWKNKWGADFSADDFIRFLNGAVIEKDIQFAGIQGKRELIYDTEMNDIRFANEEPYILCDCPECGGKIRTTASLFWCTGTSEKHNCRIYGSRKSATADYTDDDIRSLIHGESVMKERHKGDDTWMQEAVFEVSQHRIMFVRDIGDATEWDCPCCSKGKLYIKQYDKDGDTNRRIQCNKCKFQMWDKLGAIRLTEQDLDDILTKGESRMIQDIPKKDRSGVYSARIVVNKQKRTTELKFDDGGEITDWKCPCCRKGQIRKKFFEKDGISYEFYACETCGLKVWKKQGALTLTDDLLDDLFTDGKTRMIRGIQKKDGSGTYDARVVINKEKKSAETRYGDEGTQTDWKCPCCRKKAVEENVYTKNGSEKTYLKCISCGFTLWPSVGSYVLTENDINELMTEGKTELIKGISKKNGGTFDAYIKINKKEKGVSFEFPKRKGH